MNNNSFFIVDRNSGSLGLYRNVIPDFKEGVFKENEHFALIAGGYTLFGMREYFKSPVPGFSSPNNRGLDVKGVHLKSFKEFVDGLKKIGSDCGADYALISLEHNQNNGTGWLIDGYYQFLVLINPPVKMRR